MNGKANAAVGTWFLKNTVKIYTSKRLNTWMNHIFIQDITVANGNNYDECEHIYSEMESKLLVS